MLRRSRRCTLIAGILPLILALPASPAADEPHVCLLTPHGGDQAGQGPVRARVPLANPTIFAADPLAEIVLEQDGRVLWRREAQLLEPLHGPQPWPLPPLRPGERMLLRLRPAGTPRGSFATVQLEAAAAPELARNTALLQGLGQNGDRWQQAVQRAMDQRDGALVTALLFAFEGPSAPGLDELRRAAYQQGCGTVDSDNLDAPTTP
ncbi:MAG: hypothetical protein VKO65_05870 [Cyanobacteriota bacterium]|nr:hypothetical protein [Cyanobacteriota bacterium]